MTINLVREHNAKARFFSVGIGGSVSHYLVNGVSQASGGSSEFIIPHGDSSKSLTESIQRQLTRAMSSRVSIESIQWADQEPRDMFLFFFLFQTI